MKILASYGISAAAEDLAALTGTSAKSGELSEEELMQISGGSFLPSWLCNLFRRSSGEGHGGGFSSGGGHGGGGGGRF